MKKIITLLFFLSLTAFALAESPFQLEDKCKETVLLKENGKPVWEYNYRIKELPSLSFGTRQRFCSAGWFHPVYGLNGEELTANIPETYHPNHHGIWTGFMNIFVREADGEITSYNTWMDHTDLKKEFIEWKLKEATDDYFKFTVHNGWFRCRYGENPILPVPKENYVDETITVTTHKITENEEFGRHRVMEFEYTWAPTKYEVRFAGDKPGDRAFCSFAFRFAVLKDGLKPSIYNEKGLIAEDNMLCPCKWVDYVCQFQGKDKPASGVKIIPDPSNPPSKDGWAIRHYGLVVAGWPGKDGTLLKPGESVTLKYRVIFHEKVK